MAGKPDWRELLDAKLQRQPDAIRTNCIRVNARIDRIVQQAAKKRNMSVSAYIRRAVVAIAVIDLKLDWDEVMDDEPGFGLYGERPGRAVIRPDGHGFGPWRVTALESHHPDDSQPRRRPAGTDGELDAAG